MTSHAGRGCIHTAYLFPSRAGDELHIKRMADAGESLHTYTHQKMSQVYDRIGPLREEAHAWYEYLLKAFKTGAPLNDDIAD